MFCHWDISGFYPRSVCTNRIYWYSGLSTRQRRSCADHLDRDRRRNLHLPDGTGHRGHLGRLQRLCRGEGHPLRRGGRNLCTCPVDRRDYAYAVSGRSWPCSDRAKEASGHRCLFLGIVRIYRSALSLSSRTAAGTPPTTWSTTLPSRRKTKFGMLMTP